MTFTKLFSSLNNRFSSHLTHKIYVNRGIELSLPYIHFNKYRSFGVKLPERNSNHSPSLLFIEHVMSFTNQNGKLKYFIHAGQNDRENYC